MNIIKSRAGKTDRHVAQRIKMSRIYYGLSQQQLAVAINVSVQQIQKYETGVNRISSGKLYDLAKFLKLPITHFYNEMNYKSSHAGDGIGCNNGNDDNDSNRGNNHNTSNTSCDHSNSAESNSNKRIYFYEKEALTLLSVFNAIKDRQIKKHIIAITQFIAKC